MNITDAEQFAGKIQRRRFFFFGAGGALALLALAAFFFLHPVSCHDTVKELKKDYNDARAADSVTNKKIGVILDRKAGRDSIGRRLDSTAKRLAPVSRAATATINRLASKLPAPEADSIRAALAAKDSLISTLQATADTLRADTADLAAAFRIAMAGKAAAILADSIATEKGIQGIEAERAKNKKAFKTGAIIGALATLAALAAIGAAVH